MVVQTATRARLGVLLFVVITLAALAAFLWILQKRQREALHSTNLNTESATKSVPESPTSPTVSPSPSTSPLVTAPSPVTPSDSTQTPPANQDSSNAALADSYIGILKLVVPVVGVRRDQLVDTFADARSEGRVHDAIDIPAPAGTPVIAAADGQIIKLFQSDRGGTTIYQASVDRKLIFYYAHLQRYADGLANEKFVKQGETIGYVGDTGNAGAGNFHLHFSIAVVADAKRYWEGTNINPYPLLHH